mgnify:CR=1 FL=1
MPKNEKKILNMNLIKHLTCLQKIWRTEKYLKETTKVKEQDIVGMNSEREMRGVGT